MSILIKDMEMPKNCSVCKLWSICKYMRDYPDWESIYFAVHDGNLLRHKDCSLAEVPIPHGRLIDADDLYDETERGRLANPHTGKAAQCHNTEYTHFLAAISVAPTIIEAEE